MHETIPTDVYTTRTGDRDFSALVRQDPVVYGSAADGPLTAEQLRTYDEKGFITIDDFLSPAEVTAYRAELRRLAQDEEVRRDERAIVESGSNQLRSLYEIHRTNPLFADLARDTRVAGAASQLLGSPVYVHQSRVNYKPGFSGKEFYWHSDFETWHAEDGMPRMRALSVSIALTDNYPYNGSLMVMPGSHRTFVPTVEPTPPDNYKQSLLKQVAGTLDEESLTALAAKHGIELITGPAGSATIFDCNCVHGSNGNISPFPRSNIFLAFNSVENACQAPFAAPSLRPAYVAARDHTPVA